MNDTLLTLFCLVDDFCVQFYPYWQKQLITSGIKKRQRNSQMTPSEMMTLFIHFQQSRFRDFKSYYLLYVRVHLKQEFPNTLSYTRFVSLIKSLNVPLCFFLQTLLGEKTGIYFVDSTLLKVCHIKREKQHKVFKGVAKKARSTIGWFYGFKLHLVANDKGELIAFKITAGNVDDRKPVPDLVENLIGRLIGDKGYLSKELAGQLADHDLHLITKIKKNMKNKLLTQFDKVLLRKRAIIESINDQLKNICQIEHTRHRSIWSFMANILSALIAYSLQPKKPSIYAKKEMTVIA